MTLEKMAPESFAQPDVDELQTVVSAKQAEQGEETSTVNAKFEELLVDARDSPSSDKFVALAEAIATLNSKYEASIKKLQETETALKTCEQDLLHRDAANMCESAKDFSRCLSQLGYNVDAKFMETTTPAFVATASAKDILERYKQPFEHLFSTINDIYNTGVLSESKLQVSNSVPQATKVTASSADIHSALFSRKRQRVDSTAQDTTESGQGFIADMLAQKLRQK
jgi:hypothetical protein